MCMCVGTCACIKESMKVGAHVLLISTSSLTYYSVSMIRDKTTTQLLYKETTLNSITL